MMNAADKTIAGMYGAYELVFAGDEAINQYFDACLENMDEDEKYEAWQLYHLCVEDVLEKVFQNIKEGSCEAYFLLHHSSEKEYEVIGIGGFGPLAECGGNFAENVGEIWFMGQSLIRHKRFVVRYGREIVAKILSRYSALLNAAAVWNNEAFRLVRFLGFTVEEKAVRIGVAKCLFKYFYMTRKEYV